MSEIRGLREALLHETREREVRASVALKMEAAYHRVTAATAKRHAAAAKAASGEAVKISAVEAELREANETVAFLSDALSAADQNVVEAGQDIQDVLLGELGRQLLEAQAVRDEAEAAYRQAAAAWSEAAGRERSLAGLRDRAIPSPFNPRPTDLRHNFGAEIADIELALYGEIQP